MESIYTAIPAIMAETGAIGKDKKNAQQGFMYRGIDDVMNALQPLLHKHGVFVVPEVIDHKREERQTKQGSNLIYSVCTIKYTFFASDGSSITAVVVGEGMDSGDKATNKAMAIALKYACFQVFCIPTEEMKDPDAETPPPSKKAETPSRKKEPPAEERKEIYFRCDKCNDIMKPYRNSKGVEFGVRELAANTKAVYGLQLCATCASEAEKDRKAVNAD